MRISLVSPYDPFPHSDEDARGVVGGVERAFAAMARGLSRRGHEVSVICSSTHDGPGSEDAGIDVIRIRRRATLMRAPVTNLAAHVPESDVIHVAATYPFTTPGVLRLARRRGTPVVLDFHFEPDPVSRLGRAAARAYRLVGPPSYVLADQVLVRSHDYADHAPSLHGIPTGRRRTLPNGIDPARFHPDGPAYGDGNLLFVGRLVPYKGLDVLLEALSRIDAPPLWVAGDGPLRDTLRAQARELGVDVRWLGRVPDQALPALYRGASLTVLPSVGRQECFGITLLESMACGTPVVASDIPGVRAVARRGGLVAPSGDPDGWAQVLAHALDDGELERGRRLARRIHAECSWDAVTKRLESIYEGLLHHEDPGRHAVLPA